MVSYSSWLINCRVFDIPPQSSSFTTFVYLNLVAGLVVLYHSCILHRMKFNNVRICTDVTALASVVNAICFLTCIDSCSLTKTVFLVIILGNTICTGFIQAADNYIIYSRFEVICCSRSSTSMLSSSRFKHNLFLFVVLLLFVPWIVVLVFFPIFMDMNSAEGQKISDTVRIIEALLYILYDVIFTILVIREIRMPKSDTLNPKFQEQLRTLSIKLVVHNVITIGG